MPRIDLKAALAAGVAKGFVPQEIAFGELVRGYGIDSRLRPPPTCIPWKRPAMPPSSVKGDLSATGTVYRWATKRHLSPPGFLSPDAIVEAKYIDQVRQGFPEALEAASLPPNAKVVVRYSVANCS